ncbi:MAG: hypothetical protein ACTSQP_16445 [Promethearchaeota archaeon]
MESKPPEKSTSEEQKPRLPKLEIKIPSAEEHNPNMEKNKQKSSKVAGKLNYSRSQRTVATIFYIAIVIAFMITIGGAVYTIADFIMATGKMELFLSLNLGYQIAIVGSLLFGLFLLIILFYGLSKKGISNIERILFTKRKIDVKYVNKFGVKIITSLLLLSLFAIIIGVVFAIFQELLLGSSGSSLSLATLTKNYTQGQLVLFTGILLFIIVGLAFALNYLWHHGYYLILKLLTDLED